MGEEGVWSNFNDRDGMGLVRVIRDEELKFDNSRWGWMERSLACYDLANDIKKQLLLHPRPLFQ